MGSHVGGGGGSFLLLPKPCSINSRQKLVSPWNFKNPKIYISFSNILLGRSSGSWIINITAMSSRWDSNAESFGFRDKDENKNDEVRIGSDEEEEERSSRKRKKRRWWSGGPPEMEEEKEDKPGILEEAIDSIWILKVFKSYGWTLPPIILSLLLANGPKAFLTVLGLCIGQSALTFAFQKLLGIMKQSKPKRKPRKRRKPSARTVSDAKIDDIEREEKLETVKTKMGYKSWFVEDNDSANKDAQDAPQFGGWDELDGVGSMQRPRRMASLSRRKPSANGKLSIRKGKSDTPLLLRLLSAVFPFLGSWTKML